MLGSGAASGHQGCQKCLENPNFVLQYERYWKKRHWPLIGWIQQLLSGFKFFKLISNFNSPWHVNVFSDTCFPMVNPPDFGLIWGKDLNPEAKEEWVREQAQSSLVVWLVVPLYNLLSFYSISNADLEAWKCHDVLIKHTKSKRKGTEFKSPIDKKSSQGWLGQV